MKLRSAWARGLLYAAIVGILVFLAVVAVAFICNENIASTLQTAAVGLAMWGGVGFLLGFFGHRESSPEPAGDPVAQTKSSIIRQWIYRVLAGLALAHLAAAVVEGLTLIFVIVMYDGLDNFLNSRPRPHEMRFAMIGFCVMIGSALAAALGGFLGVMLAPWRYDSRLLIRSSAMAGALGALAGAWTGGSAGVLFPQYLELKHAFMLAISGGIIAGIAVAIVLRLHVNR